MDFRIVPEIVLQFGKFLFDVFTDTVGHFVISAGDDVLHGSYAPFCRLRQVVCNRRFLHFDYNISPVIYNQKL